MFVFIEASTSSLFINKSKSFNVLGQLVLKIILCDELHCLILAWRGNIVKVNESTFRTVA